MKNAGKSTNKRLAKTLVQLHDFMDRGEAILDEFAEMMTSEDCPKCDSVTSFMCDLHVWWSTARIVCEEARDFVNEFTELLRPLASKK